MTLLPSGVINDETMINRYYSSQVQFMRQSNGSYASGSPASHGKTATKLSGPEMYEQKLFQCRCGSATWLMLCLPRASHTQATLIRRSASFKLDLTALDLKLQFLQPVQEKPD